MWSPSSRTITYPPPLADGFDLTALDINNRDHITGYGSLPGAPTAAFFWSARSGTIDLGTVSGSYFTFGRAINDKDEIVGTAFFDTYTKAFYWKRGLGIVTLQSFGGPTAGAADINLAGQIVGSASS